MNYQDDDVIQIDNDLAPGKTTRTTLALDTEALFIKVIIENTDESQAASDVNVTVSLKG
jgi:hypothetical protein